MKRARNLVVSFCLTALVAAGSAQSGHAAAKPGHLGPELFLAVSRQDTAAVKALLARGADPNARNFLQFTPLIFAAGGGHTESVRALLDGGADVEAQCQFGTALTFAAMGGSRPVAELLLARGAKPNPSRPDGITVLMLAARSGDEALVRRLLAKKLPVDARDNGDATALMYAAREGKTEVMRLLIGKGASVTAADGQGWTALTHAAAHGREACVALLLEKGADADARDRQGRTALMIAAAYANEPAVLRALRERGADTEAVDGQNRTALSLAVARGNEEAAQTLREPRASAAAPAGAGAPKTARTAIASSLPLLEHTMRTFAKRTGCASCHHEGLGRVATGLARERGFLIDMALEKAQAERVQGFFTEIRPLLTKALKDSTALKNVPGTEIGEYVPIASFTLAGMAAHKRPGDATLAAAAIALARQQTVEGHWPFVLQRVPMQSSYFTTTALAIRVIQAYAPPESAAEMARRTSRAKEWLLGTPAESTEDQTFRLLGLKWAGASREELRRAAAELLAEQRSDGGWAQLGTMKSDAYATGQALFALNHAGEVPVTDPAYQRGVQLLLRTQEADGSWFVSKRAIPANNYFDAGFPHGHSQFSAFNATCWATMALLPAAEATETDLQASTK